MQALLRALRLQYGCIDMRRQPDGGYRFFEVNPSGQFLFAEIDTGQPLLRALAQVLIRPAGALDCPFLGVCSRKPVPEHCRCQKLNPEIRARAPARIGAARLSGTMVFGNESFERHFAPHPL